jgi:hypothetical protein
MEYESDLEGGNFMALSSIQKSALHTPSRMRGCSSLDPSHRMSSGVGSKNMSWNTSEVSSKR